MTEAGDQGGSLGGQCCQMYLSQGSGCKDRSSFQPSQSWGDFVETRGSSCDVGSRRPGLTAASLEPRTGPGTLLNE